METFYFCVTERQRYCVLHDPIIEGEAKELVYCINELDRAYRASIKGNRLDDAERLASVLGAENNTLTNLILPHLTEQRKYNLCSCVKVELDSFKSAKSLLADAKKRAKEYGLEYYEKHEGYRLEVFSKTKIFKRWDPLKIATKITDTEQAIIQQPSDPMLFCLWWCQSIAKNFVPPPVEPVTEKEESVANDELLEAADAIILFGKSRATFYSRVKKGLIKKQEMTTKTYYPKSSVLECKRKNP